MTKKDYIKFAKMLSEVQCCRVDCEGEEMRRDIAEKMADIFKADNNNFDRGRFLTASEVD